MAKYIDFDEACKVLNDLFNDTEDMETEEPEVYVDGFADGVDAAIEKIETIVPADVAPVKRGNWSEKQFSIGISFCCSECGGYFATPYDYCPGCGAEMNGEEGDDDV